MIERLTGFFVGLTILARLLNVGRVCETVFDAQAAEKKPLPVKKSEVVFLSRSVISTVSSLSIHATFLYGPFDARYYFWPKDGRQELYIKDDEILWELVDWDDDGDMDRVSVDYSQANRLDQTKTLREEANELFSSYYEILKVDEEKRKAFPDRKLQFYEKSKPKPPSLAPE